MPSKSPQVIRNQEILRHRADELDRGVLRFVAPILDRKLQDSIAQVLCVHQVDVLCHDGVGD